MWDDEKWRRDLEFDAERRRRQEASRREEQTCQQMQALRSLVEGVQLQGEAAKRQAEDVKVAEEDDIVSYLTMFERVVSSGIRGEEGKMGIQVGLESE